MEGKNKKEEEQIKKINELQNKVKSLEEENEKIKNEYKEVIKKEIMKELKVEKEKELTFLKLPSIVINDNNISVNKEIIKQLNFLISPSKPLYFELIFPVYNYNYGTYYESFHSCCNGKCGIIIIVYGQNGYIFGGYGIIPFSSDNKVHNDDNAFLFSITNMKIFPIKKGEPAFFHNSNIYGPCFWGNPNPDLSINFNPQKSKNENSCEPKSYEFQRVDLIGTGDINFKISKYEVYSVTDSYGE